MALTLKFNPNTNAPSGYRDKIYLSRLNLALFNSDGDAINYPTRIARAARSSDPTTPLPPQAGFLNLLEVTSDNLDEQAAFATKPFFLRIKGRKLFVLQRDYSPASGKLLIWFIVKWKRNDLEASIAPSAIAKTTFGIGDLVLTIETDEGFVESLPIDPELEV